MDLISVVTLIEQNGYWAIFLGMLLEGLCLPIPAELVLGFAGFLVSQHKLLFLGSILAGWLGSLVGSVLIYFAARQYGCGLLYKYGRLCGLTHERIDYVSQFFHKYGPIMIIPWRQLPIVRNKISVVAGLTRLPFPTFLLYIVIGTGLWSALGISLGWYLGANWQILINMLTGVSKWMMVAGIMLICSAAVFLYGRYLKTK